MNQNMKKGRKEARIGLNSEKNIVKMINTNKQFNNLIKKCLNNLGFVIQDEIKAQKNDMKTDIFIEDTSKIGVSIKTVTTADYNHIDRRRLMKWKDFLNMPDDIYIILKESILRIARNPKALFIIQQDRSKIRDFFAKHINKIIREIFTHSEENLKLLMVNNKKEHKLYLFRMEEVVGFLIEDVRDNIFFSKKGIVYLGNFIRVQRKSGDGKHITIPKTDWEHPGNQLQFKFTPRRFAEYIEKNKLIRICGIKLS